MVSPAPQSRRGQTSYMEAEQATEENQGEAAGAFLPSPHKSCSITSAAFYWLQVSPKAIPDSRGEKYDPFPDKRPLCRTT